MNKELAAIIDDLVEQKTLSLDALTGLQQLKAKAEELSACLEHTGNSLKAANQALTKSNAEVSDLSTKLAGYTAREAALAAREQKITKLECDAEKHAALAAQSKEFVGLIFRNQTLISSKMTQVALTTNGGYVSQLPESETTTSI